MAENTDHNKQSREADLDILIQQGHLLHSQAICKVLFKGIHAVAKLLKKSEVEVRSNDPASTH